MGIGFADVKNCLHKTNYEGTRRRVKLWVFTFIARYVIIKYMNKKKTIGRAEYVWLVGEGIKKVPARIDTGAKTSSLWASQIIETKAGLEFCLFGSGSPFYSGRRIRKSHFSRTVVASSNGQIQVRYKVAMTIQIKGRRIKTFCTLADRSTQAYPMLIGRNTLRGKFVVDVQNGPSSLKILEDQRSEQLQAMV